MYREPDMIKVILAACAGGMLLFFAAPYLAFALLAIVTCVYLYRKIPPPDNKFLVYVFVIGMAVRCYLAVLLTNIAYMNGHYGFVTGDERIYSLTALDILNDISKGRFVYSILSFGRSLYTYILAAFYSVFGFRFAESKFINCYIGAVIPLAAYIVAGRVVSKKIARAVSVASLIYPSFIFWSVNNLKEPLIILAVLIGAYLILKVVSRDLTVGDLVLLAVYALMIMNLQLMYIYQLGLIVLAIPFCYYRKPVRIAVLAALALLLVFLLWKTDIAARFLLFAEKHQWEMSISDRSGYYLYPKDFIRDITAGRFDILKLVFIYLKNLVFFVFTPFSWKTASMTQLLAIPQILVWYVIVILSAIGFIASFSTRPSENAALFLFVFIGISLWALTEGNMGSAFRHRDHFSVLIFTYGGIGASYLSKRVSPPHHKEAG